MSTSVLTSAERLADRFRQLRMAALLAAGTLIGVVPLLFTGPVTPWRVVAALLVLAYGVRKGLLAARAQRSIRQLRVEAQFVRHAAEPAALRRCLHQEDHLWACSLVLRTLRHVAGDGPAARAPAARRLTRLYDRVLRGMRLRLRALDPVLLGLAIAAVFASVPYPIGFGSAAFPAGLLAGALGIAAEAWHVALFQHVDRDRQELIQALQAWTPSLLERLLPAPTGYAHTRYYAARPWFGTTLRPAPGRVPLQIEVHAPGSPPPFRNVA